MPFPKKNLRDFYHEQVNAQEAAAFLGLAERTFYRLVEERAITKVSDGVYVLGDVVDSYYKHLLGNKGLTAARTRLANAEAELRELELAAEKGEMFRASDVSKAWTENVINTKTRLLAIPAKIAHELVGKDLQAVSAILKREIYEALKELADYDGEKIAAVTAEGR